MTAAVPNEDTIPANLLNALAKHGGVRTFSPNSILINAGDLTNTLYIVMSGRLKVYASSDDGREVILAELGSGEYFGELALDGGARSASVKAIEASKCCLIQEADLQQILIEHPDFALHLTRKLMRMVRRLTEQVRSLALQDVYGRLARVLTELSDPVGSERIVREKLTQQDIADRIGSSREMVNRVIKELVTGGYVSMRDGRHVLHRTLPARW